MSAPIFAPRPLISGCERYRRFAHIYYAIVGGVAVSEARSPKRRSERTAQPSSATIEISTWLRLRVRRQLLLAWSIK
jgi:hypothetical protein